LVKQRGFTGLAIPLVVVRDRVQPRLKAVNVEAFITPIAEQHPRGICATLAHLLAYVHVDIYVVDMTERLAITERLAKTKRLAMTERESLSD
jgi:hypothetical protein